MTVRRKRQFKGGFYPVKLGCTTLSIKLNDQAKKNYFGFIDIRGYNMKCQFSGKGNFKQI